MTIALMKCALRKSLNDKKEIPTEWEITASKHEGEKPLAFASTKGTKVRDFAW